MRQIISFMLAAALFVAGGYFLYFQIFLAPGWHGIFVMGAVMMLIAGGAWLISDFVLPLLRRKESE